jgi:hypothetical protein
MLRQKATRRHRAASRGFEAFSFVLPDSFSFLVIASDSEAIQHYQKAWIASSRCSSQ